MTETYTVPASVDGPRGPHTSSNLQVKTGKDDFQPSHESNDEFFATTRLCIMIDAQQYTIFVRTADLLRALRKLEA